ncbi:unnamed protein product (macronuclear) [Paramecium tetraurelia]|uniref:Uncharacterized protein n=1 Tax=Paramecium tetraurelia TaxID=5888 RepID=A0DVJ6_PARTE|nr:uncharacterized protein GSPATT00020716001 [Paramecium tetraurelia]CAK87063.1 unnamed protein product [Paramecium tetraurelia]|eukprot:XP_001454460.1 hypothetical protein (macronuclear) [Paramecium tetraurelia strain d4-2]
MGIQHTCCMRECSNREQNPDSEVQVIQNQQNFNIKRQFSIENQTLKTTQKGTIQISEMDNTFEMLEENQSSNLENNPVPAFVQNKQFHQSMVPRRENRFMQDIECEVRERIKQIYIQDKFEALQSHYSELNHQQNPSKSNECSSKVPNYNESNSNLNFPFNSSLGIEKLQSTQLECITVPHKEMRGILKSDSSQKYSQSLDAKTEKAISNKKRVHFSQDTKFKTQDATHLFKWRNLRNI